MDIYHTKLKEVLGSRNNWEGIEKYYLFLVSWIDPDVAYQQIATAYEV